MAKEITYQCDHWLSSVQKSSDQTIQINQFALTHWGHKMHIYKSVIQYSMVLYMALQQMGQSLITSSIQYEQKTPHTSPSWVRYGVSFVRICEKIDCIIMALHCIWVRSQNCGCLVTWFRYQLIAKPGNRTATVLWPDPYVLGLRWRLGHRCFSLLYSTMLLPEPMSTYCELDL